MTPDSLKRFLVMAISALATLSSLFLKIDVPPDVQAAAVLAVSFIVSTYLHQSGKKAAEKLRLDAFRGGVTDAELIAAAEKLRGPIVIPGSAPGPLGQAGVDTPPAHSSVALSPTGGKP